MKGETKYAISDGYSIAWQAMGSGPEIVMIPGFVSNVEMIWEIPAAARFLERLGSFCRLIHFDKRGTGLSDRVPVSQLTSLEERTDDVRAVMDAAGSDRAILFGISEGGPMAALFAATYPERVEGLLLYGSYARRAAATSASDQLEPFVARIEKEWGKGTVLAERSATVSGERGTAQMLGRLERHSASPSAAAAIVRMGYQIDVTDVLSSVAAPTIVLHRTNDANISIDGGRALADGIPGTRLIELPGSDHLPFFGESTALLTEIQEFVTGNRPEAAAERFLGTVLFVDIVESTRIAAEMGDLRWTDLLHRFFAETRMLLERHRGTEINTMGDGFLALFEGPARAVRCALDIRDSVADLDLAIRSGLHTGEVRRRGADLAGIAVHIGARVGGVATAGEVWTSRTVRDVVAGSGLVFSDRGVHSLKGVPEEWRLYAAERG